MSHDKDCAANEHHEFKETESREKATTETRIKEMEAKMEELTAETETLKHDKIGVATEHHEFKEALAEEKTETAHRMREL